MQFRLGFSFDSAFGLDNWDHVVNLLSYCIYAALAANALCITSHLVRGGDLIQLPGTIYSVVLPAPVK